MVQATQSQIYLLARKLLKISNILNEKLTVNYKNFAVIFISAKKDNFDLISTRPAWAGFKTAEEGIAIIMSYIL